ncbi:MAG: hypothetical protein HOH95_11195 [Dehalococcoidia bacterium]|jgi:hypothetical protein|nr:hypothetical protein [Dehalococcoidia bacterium]
MNKLAIAGASAALLVVLTTSLASSAGMGGTVGDAVSDGLLGNEPNIIEWDDGNDGPAEVEPGSIGDLGGNSGHPNSVENSGAPGPISCGGGWYSMALVVGANTDTTPPGDADAPGMNVSCGDGGNPPHSP